MIDEQEPWGLGESPAQMTIFIGDDDSEDGVNLPWYRYDIENDKKVPLPGNALYANFVEIRIKKTVFKGKEGFKTRFIFGTPLRRYAIQSGSDTAFTRKLLLLLQTVPDFGIKLCLSVKFGDDKKIVFPSLWNIEYSTVFRADWDDKIQLFPIVNELRKRLGHKEQTLAEIRKEYEEYKK